MLDTQAITQDYEQLCEQGRMYQQDLDANRWSLGELALQVSTSYGDSQLVHFANMINVSKSSVYEYKKVTAWLADNPHLRKFKDEPVLTYSHIRKASRIKDIAQAEAFLNQCADDALTPDAASVVAAKLEGKSVKVKLLEFTAELDERGAILFFDVPDNDALKSGKQYIIRVYSEG